MMVTNQEIVTKITIISNIFDLIYIYNIDGLSVLNSFQGNLIKRK